MLEDNSPPLQAPPPPPKFLLDRCPRCRGTDITFHDCGQCFNAICESETCGFIGSYTMFRVSLREGSK